MSFEPIRRDTPANTLIAAMERVENATSAIVILTVDRDKDKETHLIFANEDVTLSTAAWILDSVKLELHGWAKRGGDDGDDD